MAICQNETFLRQKQKTKKLFAFEDFPDDWNEMKCLRENRLLSNKLVEKIYVLAFMTKKNEFYWQGTGARERESLNF